MGCNTSQELKNKDANAVATQEEAGGGEAGGIANNTANTVIENGEQNGKSNSIISNGDANKRPPNDAAARRGDASAKGAQPRQCDKAEISELNAMDDDDEDEEKAATKIQAVFRGHKVRADMKKTETKNTPTAAAATTNNAAAGNESGAASAAADPTKAELEAEFDPNDKDLCNAALKIQAAFRGHLTRKIANKDEPEDVDIQEITKKVAEELDIDLTDPELNKAATKIQASFRGHKTRKDVSAPSE